jgi:hypothetical protein
VKADERALLMMLGVAVASQTGSDGIWTHVEAMKEGGFEPDWKGAPGRMMNHRNGLLERLEEENRELRRTIDDRDATIRTFSMARTESS